MSAMQTTVRDVPIGFPGMLGDARIDKVTASRAQEEATAEMRFGIMVKEGVGPNGVLLLVTNNALATNVFAGVVQHGHWYAKPDELGDTGLKPKTTVGVLQTGPIWVYCEQTPLKTDHVRVRCVAVGSEIAGAFRVTADSTDCIDITAYARWTGRVGTGIAEVVIDITNRALGVAD